MNNITMVEECTFNIVNITMVEECTVNIVNITMVEECTVNIVNITMVEECTVNIVNITMVEECTLNIVNIALVEFRGRYCLPSRVFAHHLPSSQIFVHVSFNCIALPRHTYYKLSSNFTYKKEFMCCLFK